MTRAERIAEARRLALSARIDPEDIRRFNEIMAEAERKKREIELEFRLRSALRRANQIGGS